MIAERVPIGEWQILDDRSIPAMTDERRNRADIIIVAGNDLANAPWLGTDDALIDPGLGRLLVIDATGSDNGQWAANATVEELRDAGVDVTGVVTAAAALEQSMLMPIGDTTPWTFAIQGLAGIGGFDTWSPNLVAGPIPDGVTAALVIAG